MEDRERLLRTLKFFGLILLFITGYIVLKGSRYCQLAGYFAYMSVACTVIPLPTPPYVIAMGKVFHPVIVATVGAVGNCIAAIVEYYFITWLFNRSAILSKVEANKIFIKFSRFFKKAAFLCLIFTGFTPIPFEPFRLAAIAAKYPMTKYLAAVFIGRSARYYLIALLGYVYQISTLYLIVLMLVMLIVPIISSLKSRSVSQEEIVTEN